MKFKFLLIILGFSLISIWLVLAAGCTSTYEHVNYPVDHPANSNAVAKQPIENSGLLEADPIEIKMTERLSISSDSGEESHHYHEGSHSR